MHKTRPATTPKTKPRQKPEAEAGDADGGPDERTPLRRCIVTRSVLPKRDLIRFVAAPDGAVVPDLKGRLPGRGVWVLARRWAVAEAAKRNLFARSLKTRVRAGEGLADEVAERLRESALGALGLARKGGRLAVGFTEVDGLLRKGGALLVLHAREAAADGVRKLDQASHAGGRRTEICRAFTAAELGLALGRSNVIHAALEDYRGGDAAAERCRSYELYLRDGDADIAGKPAQDDGERTNE